MILFFQRKFRKTVILFALLLSGLNSVNSQTTNTYSVAGSTTWTVPACVTSITVQAWAGGGGGGGVASYINGCFNTDNEACSAGGGGGGGGFVSRVYTVIPGEVYTIVVGAGGAGGVGSGTGATGTNLNNGSPGGNSTFSGPATVVPGILTAIGGGFGGGARTNNNNTGNHLSLIHI